MKIFSSLLFLLVSSSVFADSWNFDIKELNKYYNSQNNVLYKKDQIYEIKHSASSVMRMLKNKDYIEIPEALANRIIGSSFTKEPGKRLYLVRATAAGPGLEEVLLTKENILLIIALGNYEATVDPNAREYTPIENTAIVVSLDAPPAKVMPFVLLQ